MLQACLNGPRRPDEHPALPVTPEALARDAVDCVRAGAHAIHMHARDATGAESLEPAVIDSVTEIVREACRAPVGVSTGAWIEPDPERRAALLRGWAVPDFASVNLSEQGAVDVMRALLDAGIGIEAGIWTAADAHRLAASGLARRVLRVLVEVVENDSQEEIDAALDEAGIDTPRLYHGEDDTAWPVLVHAASLGRDIRVGLEDVLVDREGRSVAGNAELVAVAAALL